MKKKKKHINNCINKRIANGSIVNAWEWNMHEWENGEKGEKNCSN